MIIRKPYLLFLGDIKESAYAKTAFGVRDWTPEDCIAQWSIEGTAVDLGLDVMSPDVAQQAGARSLLIGVAPVGGAIPKSWVPYLEQALRAGLDIVSGMHSRLAEIPGLTELAEAHGCMLHDVRHNDSKFPIGTGRKRTGKRLLTVGTDCALGKKYAALAITRALQDQGIAADFRATGQTGIMIAGSGVAVDAVISDFLCGAVETLSPDNDPDHWDVIEGQGSLFHPAYAGVTVGLLHGSQPDAMILCHDPSRRHIAGYPDFPIHDLREAIAAYSLLAKLTNPKAEFIAVAVNSSSYTEAEAATLMINIATYVGLPCFDPMRSDLSPVVNAVRAMG
ncbi:DUF1611 domain-containing protein [Alphaproteobacteria bacterium LMG 31809]|uniref:DUF1611 domain-containing protein n=1 Tax=Govanella unica TaxID=2975056 RepID=A0A9X3Z8Q2_9PROT|nr:DUF1611 domain-containing protein [Govania unica]